jgi:hypothetical protein
MGKLTSRYTFRYCGNAALCHLRYTYLTPRTFRRQARIILKFQVLSFLRTLLDSFMTRGHIEDVTELHLSMPQSVSGNGKENAEATP